MKSPQQPADFEHLIIRPLSQDDVPSLVGLSQDAGWHQTPTAIQNLITRYDTHTIGAFADNTLIGVAAACCYPDVSFAFVNEVIVHSVWRRHGIATRLLNTLLPSLLADCPTVRLYASDLGRPIYANLGFAPYGTVCFCQFHQTLSKPSERLCRVTEDDLPAICALDKTQFGASRDTLLRHRFAESPQDAWCLKTNGRLSGFILKGPQSWILQSQSREDLVELVLHANFHLGSSYLVCLWQEDASALAEFIDCPVRLTAMQYGTALPFPLKHHSGCLPDLG